MNISDSHDVILPRTNDITFAIHVNGASHYRYLQRHFAKSKLIQDTCNRILTRKKSHFIYINPIVTGHNSNFRYPKLKKKKTLDIHNVILNNKNVIMDIHNLYYD